MAANEIKSNLKTIGTDLIDLNIEESPIDAGHVLSEQISKLEEVQEMLQEYIEEYEKSMFLHPDEDSGWND